MVWEEDGRYPDLIIELLSTSTANVDRTLKKDLYQNRFRTPEYFWFSPETLEFQGFRLVGHEYEAILPNENGWRWSEELGLYLGVAANQLRYFSAQGEMVPTMAEAIAQSIAQAKQATAQAEQVQQELEQERAQRLEAQQRAEQLAARLREIGIDPD